MQNFLINGAMRRYSYPAFGNPGVHNERDQMIRKLKTLGVAAFAVLALSAIGASAAQAANYTASAYPTSFTAETAKGNDTFTTEAGTVECKSHYSGSLSKASESITVNASYSNCEAFSGFASATVNMNGCDYTFYTSGAVDLNCGSKGVVITAGTCEAEIGGQTGLKSVTQKNVGNHITVDAAVKSINYTVLKDGFACPFGGTGAKTGASYTTHSAATVQSTSGTNIHIG